MRKKSERVLKLLEKGPLLKEEREHARKIKREIKGFGSFSGRSTSPLKDSSTTYGRSHSQFNEHGNKEDSPVKNKYDQPRLIFLGDDEKRGTVKRFYKENKAPVIDFSKGNFHAWDDDIGEKNSLLDEKNGGVWEEEEDHPFNDTEEYSRMSLLDATKED